MRNAQEGVIQMFYKPQIKNLEGLDKSVKKVIVFACANFCSLKGIVRLPLLDYLEIRSTPLSDLTILNKKYVPSLRHLNLSQNRIDNLEGI